MEFIQLNPVEHAAHVGLSRGRSNALNRSMLQELQDTLDMLQRDDHIQGIILHGNEGFFSSGLDLIELYDYNEQQIAEFWEAFLHLISSFVAFDKPAVAAITGHSPAGGCVLALCCDYRIMAAGEYIIGLNELAVGIVVPESIFRLCSFWTGNRIAYQFLLEGRLLSPQDALGYGLVDEVTDMKHIRQASEKQLTNYMQLEQHAWRQTKRYLRDGLLRHFHSWQEEVIAAVLKQWWAPSTRSIVHTVIQNLKNH